MEAIVRTESNASVWNSRYNNPPLLEDDPASYPTSPEKMNAERGFDGDAAICDGKVTTFLRG